jgi:hypothetical protein
MERGFKIGISAKKVLLLSSTLEIELGGVGKEGR